MKRVEWKEIVCAAVISAASCGATLVVSYGLGGSPLSWQWIAVWLCVLAAATAGVELGKGGRP